MGFVGGLPGRVVAVAVVLVLLAVVFGVFFYATDQPVDATVQDKRCMPGDAQVTVKTKLFGVTRQVPLENTECAIINVGNFVEYHIRSGHTIVYETEGGKCVYDSVQGPGCGQAAFLL